MFRAVLLLAFLLTQSARAQDTSAAARIMSALSGMTGAQEDVTLTQVVTRQRPNRPVETRTYTVLSNADGRSLVEFTEPAERGQKILSTADAMWFYAPRTRRAIRVPPAQRLFGDASLGDIAGIRWDRDYEIVSIDAEATDARPPAWRVTWRSLRANATYARAILWLDLSSLAPLRGEFYLASGRLNKIARYTEVNIRNGRIEIDAWQLSAPSTPLDVTEIRRASVSRGDIPDVWFTRAYLEGGR